MFRAIYQTKHGDTVGSTEPKIDAYKQAAAIARLGGLYSMTFHETGAVTVSGSGLADITFAPESEV